MSTSFRVRGLILKDHFIKAPLHYARPDIGSINIYAREVRKASDTWKETSSSSSDGQKKDKHSKYLLYLQGGPGGRCGRPSSIEGWTDAALEKGYRVILMDQRGTGLSTRASVSFLRRKIEKDGVEATADYLSHFRADNICRDAEELRKYFSNDAEHPVKWSLLGQSFGGFVSVSYLSMFPDSLKEIMITGGLPPLIEKVQAADETYKTLFERVKLQNAKYYQRYPDDIGAVQRIVGYLLSKGGVRMPKGGLLTARGFQACGILFGLLNGFETVHYVIEDAWDSDSESLSHEFLCGVEGIIALDEQPLYLLLHESIYCGEGGASDWACERVRDSEGLRDVFDAATQYEKGNPILFTGEMMFPWMLEELSAFHDSPGLKQLGNLLAKKKWGSPLYDLETLKDHDKVRRVPVAAVSYVEDMFVDFDLSRETGKLIGSKCSSENGKRMRLGDGTDSAYRISSGSPLGEYQEHVRILMTSAYNHSGVREDGGALFKKLQEMLGDEVPLR